MTTPAPDVPSFTDAELDEIVRQIRLGHAQALQPEPSIQSWGGAAADAIAALRAERAPVTSEEVERAISVLCREHTYHECNGIAALIERLARELADAKGIAQANIARAEANAKDAERYRALREYGCALKDSDGAEWYWGTELDQQMDAQGDAALAQSQPREGSDG